MSRVIRLEAEPPILELGVTVDGSKLLRRFGSPLQEVQFQPDPARGEEVGAALLIHDLPTWVGRCAAHYGLPSTIFYFNAECEQGLISETDPSVTRIPCLTELYDVPQNRPVPVGADSIGIGRPIKTRIFGSVTDDMPRRWIRSKNGWIRMTGDWKTGAATGVAIPHVGAQTVFSTEYYLGLDLQAYWVFRVYHHWINKWNEGVRNVTLGDGEEYECGSPLVSCILHYTWTSGLADAMNLLKTRCGVWRKFTQ